MTRYAAFLRGVNVGGVNLVMADVAAALRDAGFGDVRTVLASGNVMLDADEDEAAVRERMQTVLRAEFGYGAWVLVYDLETVRAIAQAYPFEPDVEGHHSYVTFVGDPAVLDELAALTPGPGEKVRRGARVLYWQVPKSATLTSAVGATMGKKRYKSSTTTRNLRTLVKVLR